MSQWHVYIVRCSDQSLYTGIAKDVCARVAQHNAGKGARYTRGRLPVELVYREAIGEHGAALRREIAIKRLRASDKKRLIGHTDPERIMDGMNPLLAHLGKQAAVILDAGLATALESQGHILTDELWSARILIDRPDAIRQVHIDFLEAGADCITTSSYQASLPGFSRAGLTVAEGERLLRRSVALAVEARDAFWSKASNRRHRLRPLVAASIGPYGAFLADGSEYTGRYGISDDELLGFHRARWEILNQCEVDLFACETIPSRQEARVLLRLLGETRGRWAWMSFSCRDQAHLCDGSRIRDVAGDCDAGSRVAAVGVNCSFPGHIDGLIAEIRKGSGKPIIVYPNSGDCYDAESKDWLPSPQPFDLESASVGWLKSGASCIGGCCRVHSADITGIRRRLIGR
jgi:homocysteine S-methyltransferase